jgi:HlyD family secretion protein
MTATAAVTVTQLADTLLVPNAALRFAPPEEVARPATTERRGLIGALMPRPGRPGVTRQATAGRPTTTHRVWILQENQPVPVEIVVGATDGALTQVLSGDVTAGTAVLVDVITGG